METINFGSQDSAPTRHQGTRRKTKPASRGVVRVVLASHHQLVRSGLRCLVERIPSIRVIGEATDSQEALELARAQQAHVMVLEPGTNDNSSLDTVARIVRGFPRLRIVVLTACPEPHYAASCYKAGAAGVLLKRDSVADLKRAILAVARGNTFASPALDRKPGPNCLNSSKSLISANKPLTMRQRQILQRLAEGRTTKEIAFELGLSAKTVEFHRARLMVCLGVRDLASLVRHALRIGLVPLHLDDAN